MTQTFDVTELRSGKKSILVQGRARTYKTRFLATVPKPLVVFDIGNGALSLATDAKPGEITIYRFNNPTASKIGTTQNRTPQAKPLEDFITEFNKLFDLPKEKMPASVAIDELSELGNMVMEYVLQKTAKVQPEFQHWGMAQEKIREIIRAGLDLPCHFILIAHDKTDKDEITGQVSIQAAIYGQLAGEIPRFFDDVFYADPGKDKDGSPIPQFLCVPKDMVKVAGSRFNPQLAKQRVVAADWKAIYGDA